MDLAPILHNPWHVQLHVLTAVLAFVVGPFAMMRRSRDIWHKVFGYTWVTAMLITALTSFWIFGFRLIGPFSPIHGLSIYVIWSLASAIWHVRNGNIAEHRATMLQLYLWAVCVTGLATLLPGRSMNLALLGGADGVLTYAAVGLAICGVIFVYFRRVLPLGKAKHLH